jgi:hypothetical protein
MYSINIIGFPENAAMSFATLHTSRHSLRNWTALMADSRKARRPGSVSLLKADGSYNLASIMREAVRCARRYPSLPTWQRRTAVALRHVWSRAKAERLAGAH